MNRLSRSVCVMTLALATMTSPILAQSSASATNPGAAGSAEQAGSSADGIVGRWTGSAILTNVSGSSPCRYETKAEPPGVVLEVSKGAAGWAAVLTVDLHATTGCPAVSRRVNATNVVVNGRRISFLDPDRNSWTLARRQSRLVGLVSGGGTAGSLGLEGEVDLALAGKTERSTEVTAAPEKKGGVSGKAIGAFIGVNVVAGAGVNQLGKSPTEDVEVTCSPRECYLPEPCNCNTPTVTGATCGTTGTGIPYLAACNTNAGLPCEAGLSCVGGLCESRDGLCGY
jgi:hypothetical protein